MARLRNVRANANAAINDARVFIAELKETKSTLETKTLEVMTSLLESVNAFNELIENIQDGVTVELMIKDKPLPVKARLLLDD